MRLSHDLAKTHASFDDPHLVSRAGLVPVMALAERAGLADLVAASVRPGGCGVNAPVKVPLYRFRTHRRRCSLRFGRMNWLRQDRGLCPFACST